MVVGFYLLSGFLILASIIPFVSHQHWFFRAFDFGKVQFLMLQTLVCILGFGFLPQSNAILVLQMLNLVCIAYNTTTLIKYTPIYKVKKLAIDQHHSDSVSLLSANIHQFNREYGRFIDLVNNVQPDIVLTMESNQAWEDALQTLEKDFPYQCKVPLENTYGMHLYSKLKMTDCQVHYFVANDIPSIEANLRTRDGHRFTLFCVHPPPPSPTEEPNSKERDGELLSIARKIKKDKHTTVVVGDFNNVAWARSSVLFRRMSETIDPRIGRGLISSFHAKYWFLRFPIDQLFHSTDVFIQDLKVLPDFGSDHLPLFCQFYVNKRDDAQEDLVEELEEGDLQEAKQMIADGITAQSEREAVANE